MIPPSAQTKEQRAINTPIIQEPQEHLQAQTKCTSLPGNDGKRQVVLLKKVSKCVLLECTGLGKTFRWNTIFTLCGDSLNFYKGSSHSHILFTN